MKTKKKLLQELRIEILRLDSIQDMLANTRREIENIIIQLKEK